MLRVKTSLEMTKFLLLLVASLAVIHRGSAANTKRSDVSFIDSYDEAEAVREKIRTEMDNYKKIKEMLFKNKLLSSTTLKPIETSPVTESTTLVENDPTTASTTTIEATESTTEVLPASSASPVESSSTELPLSTSEPSVVISSTIRHISQNLDIVEIDDDEVEGSPVDFNNDETTITPEAGNSSLVEDRFILDAPTICKGGQTIDHAGRCRKIVR